VNTPTVLEEIFIPITVDYLTEDQVYLVSCPWLQGCHAWGETLDEAIRAIPENIRAMIDARRANGSPLPPPLDQIDSQYSFTLRMVAA
jgi:predicted RNase H-like HicB family nuclease